jgi:hypothetical protein
MEWIVIGSLIVVVATFLYIVFEIDKHPIQK